MIENSVLPIYTVVDGYAASSGTLISICGKKRYIANHSYMLIHELSYGMHGKFKHLKDGMDNAKRFMSDIEKLYESKTKITKQRLKKYMQHDHWWNTDKCLKNCLVDEIWTDK